jgi:hypothetical protein
VLAQLRRTPLREASDQWEKDHLAAAETTVRQTLTVVPGELAGVATLPDVSGDVFVASWTTNLPGEVSRISAWDTPAYTFLVLRCHAEPFQSPQTTQQFLKKVIAWRIGHLYPVSVRGQFGQMPFDIFLIGSGILPYPLRYGAEFQLEARRWEGGVSLVFMIGKYPFESRYPEGSVYVPERFPPLRERAKTWGREELIRQIQKVQAEGPLQAFPRREEILFGEALSRGLNEEEVLAILAPPGEHAFPGARMGALLRVMIERGQVPKYGDLFAAMALQYGREPVAGRFVADAIFNTLARTQEVDLLKEAIECVAHFAWKEGAFFYLERQATAESIGQLEVMAVPAEMLKRKDVMLGRIRTRLKLEKR